MKFLPFNTDPTVQLRWRYHCRLGGLNLLCIVLGAGIGGYIGSWLAALLQLGDGPLRDQPHGLLWAVLFFFGFSMSVLVCHLLSFVLMAVTLHWSYGWSWERIRELMFESRIPPHWLKPARPPVAKPPPARWQQITASLLMILFGAVMLVMGQKLPNKILHLVGGVMAISLGIHALFKAVRNRPNLSTRPAK